MEARNLASVMVSECARKNALAKQDALAYFRTCDRYGFPPEDEELYELGSQMAQMDERAEQERSPIPGLRRTDNKYKRLLEKTTSLGINVDDISAHPLNKRRIFQECFPHQYEAQKIPDRDDVYVGAVYKKLVQHAKKVESASRR